MHKAILHIRLSYIYPSLFVFYFFFLSVVAPSKLTSGQLALYSVNTFLFGFYFAPLLTAQKTRVDNLNKTIRQEAMVLLDILGQSHLLKADVRHDLKVRLRAYVGSIYKNMNVKADNAYYDELLRFTKQDKFKNNSVMDVIYNRVAKTQENRDSMQNLISSNVFSHEWLVVTVLFTVTIYFVLQTDYNGVILFRFLLAILCTGITLMLVILLKYATLTHKQAKRCWQPIEELTRNHFEDITASEVEQIKHELAKAA